MKIFRDPLYNYVGIDLPRDKWILELIQTPEFQRLRRIHQLGVSNVTYPGADHNRLAHSLGVVHLMGMAWDHIERSGQAKDPQVERARHPLLAAALLHDIGHGPFSHVFEPCLGVKHEEWSSKIIKSPSTEVHKILKKYDISHDAVTALIEEDNDERPAWQKSLLSSQLDVDRLDYLRRDNLFTGAGYGHFDWYRILNTFKIHGPADGHRDLVWEEKSMYAIEEYVFARFYMYENVYHHRTTRGFEKILQALWKRARSMFDKGDDIGLVEPIQAFWKAEQPSIDQYLALEEFVVLAQMQIWKESKDQVLRDLSHRFLNRDRLVAICVPVPEKLRDNLTDDELKNQLAEWDENLHKLAKSNGIESPEYFILCDTPKEKLYKTIGRGYGPYVPEKESSQQSPINAIRILPDGSDKPVEISQMLKRLRAVTTKPEVQIRYYVPYDLREAASKILQQT